MFGNADVDVSNNTAQFVVDREILDQIPTPIRNTPARARAARHHVTRSCSVQYNMERARLVGQRTW